MIWILSRIALGSDVSWGSMTNNKVNFDSEHAIVAGVLAMDLMPLQPRRDLSEWSQQQTEITKFDFIRIDVPSLENLQSWTGQSLIINHLANSLITKDIIEPAHSSLNFNSQIDFVLPAQCCNGQADRTARNETALSFDRNAERPVFGSRLSAYLWLFARSGSSVGVTNSIGTTLQPGSAQYGGSQAGAILSYRLTGDIRRNIAVYSRVSSPLSVKGAAEVAVGAKVKPVKALPISIYAENRFRETSSDGDAQAIFVAGGSGPDELLPGVFLETYGQAGYVFQKDSSYFFDGSASIHRNVLKTDAGQISLGGGLWAGGQKGARRVDIGPRMNVDIPFGASKIRASVDWRQRVAGNADPNSGLAVSLSTGF